MIYFDSGPKNETIFPAISGIDLISGPPCSGGGAAAATIVSDRDWFRCLFKNIHLVMRVRSAEGRSWAPGRSPTMSQHPSQGAQG
jgi:hypothetical protein